MTVIIFSFRRSPIPPASKVLLILRIVLGLFISWTISFQIFIVPLRNFFIIFAISLKIFSVNPIIFLSMTMREIFLIVFIMINVTDKIFISFVQSIGLGKL